MEKGILLKGYSGFYYVNIKGRLIECSLRGKFRRKKQSFLPGDHVLVTILDKDKGVIESVEARKTELVRPPIANVEQVVIVMAVKEPEFQLDFLNRLLVLAELKEIKPIICFNKNDLLTDSIKSLFENTVHMYENIGYQVIRSSVKENEGINDLKEALKEKISVFAGLSGVGKSSLLNKIEPGLSLSVGQVSKKIKRGRHTTRHVELLMLSFGGMVADTPGFSNLSLDEVPAAHLGYCFPEIEKIQQQCRFSGCQHLKEPGCAVKDAVEEGEISSNRYEDYIRFLEEIRISERRF